MSRISRKAISIFVCTLLVLTTLAVPAFAAPSDFTVTVSADAESVKPGDIVTVNVKVTGHQFCGAQMVLSYDAESFEYISSMSGWSDEEDGRLEFYNVNASGGYWEDGKVLGTFKFMVKDNAPAGDAAFCVGADSDVFIVGDWAEGASSEPAKPVPRDRLKSVSVKIMNDGTAPEEPTDFGAISDDGSILNMEAGHKVYSIPDADNEKVIWKSSNESVVTVDETGLVTAVSDGDAILTATDEAGNELEQRTVIVGAAQKAPEETAPDTPEETAPDTPEETAPDTPEETVQPEPEKNQTQAEQKDSPVSATETSAGHLWVALAALVAVVICATVIIVKKKRAK